MIGTFKAKVISKEIGTTGTGKEQIVIGCELLDCTEEPAAHVYYRGFFTDAAMERTIKAMKAAGWKGGEDIFNLDGIGDVEVSLVMEEEEYQGKKQNKVRWLNPARKEMPADKAAAFRERMRAALKSSAAATGPAGDEPPPQEEPPF